MSTEERKKVAEDNFKMLLNKFSPVTQRRITSTPAKYRHAYAKALGGLATPRGAIKMKCIECVCFENVQSQIGTCSVRSCSLWPYRPFQDKTEQDMPENEDSGFGPEFD